MLFLDDRCQFGQMIGVEPVKVDGYRQKRGWAPKEHRGPVSVPPNKSTGDQPKDFALYECSCPDVANPYKYIAGVYFRLAGQLDRDPFLLFELRGRPAGVGEESGHAVISAR